MAKRSIVSKSVRDQAKTHGNDREALENAAETMRIARAVDKLGRKTRRAKKKTAKKTPSNPPTSGVTPYVQERIGELAQEHGWDAPAVEEMVAPKKPKAGT